eukprot:3332567-Pleurochrysis_carterae.AAC.1
MRSRTSRTRRGTGACAAPPGDPSGDGAGRDTRTGRSSGGGETGRVWHRLKLSQSQTGAGLSTAGGLSVAPPARGGVRRAPRTECSTGAAGGARSGLRMRKVRASLSGL